MIPLCLTLSIMRYISRVKWSNPREGVAPSPTPWCSSYWKGSLRITLDYRCQLYFTILIVVAFDYHFWFIFPVWRNDFNFLGSRIICSIVSIKTFIMQYNWFGLLILIQSILHDIWKYKEWSECIKIIFTFLKENIASY